MHEVLERLKYFLKYLGFPISPIIYHLPDPMSHLLMAYYEA